MPRWAKILLIILALYLIYKVPAEAANAVQNALGVLAAFGNSVGTFITRLFS